MIGRRDIEEARIRVAPVIRATPVDHSDSLSRLAGRPVRREVAMTGEITLRGKVLPIGGLKEKLLAAHRAGIKIFILPEKNRKDLHEVPEEVKNSMELVLVKHVDEVLDKALLPAATRPPTPGLGFRRPLADSQAPTTSRAR